MLTSSFQCFDGIGKAAECKLWNSNCLSWNDFLRDADNFLSQSKYLIVCNQIKHAQSALHNTCADWFINRLPPNIQMRVLYDFMPYTLFLDIETTGLQRKDIITTITTHKNGITNCYVKDINMHYFYNDIAHAKLLVTYNGIKFDVPFIRKIFNIDVTLPHIDLMLVLHSYGFFGGLKKAEKQLGISRSISESINGEVAVELWHAWEKQKDKNALHSLITYNIQDVHNLVSISQKLMPRSMNGFPIRVKPPCVNLPNIEDVYTRIAL